MNALLNSNRQAAMRPSRDRLIEAAVWYTDAANLTVIPLRQKRPVDGWKDRQHTRPSASEVRQRFADRNVDGIGCVMGQQSNGLACRDFDRPEEYDQWRRRFPNLATEWPTARTGRGLHVYFRLDSPAFAKLPDGELIGNRGHYAVLPPSLHPTGTTYTWITPPIVTERGRFANVPTFSLAGLVRIGLLPSNFRPTHPRQNPTPCTPPTICVTFDGLDAREQVELAIVRSQPTGPGQRNAMLFQFARRLKAIPALAGAEADDLEQHVRAWHAIAKPTISTKDFAASWADFRRSWPVALPFGEETLPMQAAALAREQPPAEVADWFAHADVQLLAGLCCWMGKLSAGEFFLGTRDAAVALGLSGRYPEKSAWRFLRRLESPGPRQVIECVQRGTPGVIVGGKASRFRVVVGTAP